MQQIVHCASAVSAIVSSVAAVLRGHMHCLWRSTIGSRDAIGRVKVAAPAPRLEPAREWEMVVGRLARDLSRAAAIGAIQAHAAVKVDAAEHAYNRIVTDCAEVLASPAAPTLLSARRLVPQAEPQLRRPLAA